MPREASIVGTHRGRPQSPAVELAMQEAIGEALAELLSTKGLYQKTEVDSEVLAGYSNKSAEFRTSGFPMQALVAEFRKRPWHPISMNHGPRNDNGLSALHALMRSAAVGTSDDEMPLNFPLPDIEHWCDQCGKTTAHGSMNVSFMYGLGSPFPKLADSTEDLFVLCYQCSLCRKQETVFLVKRLGYRLQLCGRSQRLMVNVPKEVPKEFRDIYSDAVSAVCENDVAAGFYHLRTLLEHYMKKCLKMPLDQQTRGDELAARYKSTLDSRMSGGIPSLGTIYEKASGFMHSRTGNEADFQKLVGDFAGHLKAKELFGRYGG